MKIVKNDGCITHGIFVDGDHIDEYGVDRLLDYLIPKIREQVIGNKIWIGDVIDLLPYSSFKTSEDTCETCGDSVSTTTWDI